MALTFLPKSIRPLTSSYQIEPIIKYGELVAREYLGSPSQKLFVSQLSPTLQLQLILWLTAITGTIVFFVVTITNNLGKILLLTWDVMSTFFLGTLAIYSLAIGQNPCLRGVSPGFNGNSSVQLMIFWYMTWLVSLCSRLSEYIQHFRALLKAFDWLTDRKLVCKKMAQVCNIEISGQTDCAFRPR